MNSEQMLMGLAESQQGCCENAGADEFIANRLAESTTGKVCLMESICAVENRRAALKRVVRNNGAPGIDGVTRKGPWRVSDYMQMNFALPAKWFEKHYGLIRLR